MILGVMRKVINITQIRPLLSLLTLHSHPLLPSIIYWHILFLQMYGDVLLRFILDLQLIL